MDFTTLAPDLDKHIGATKLASDLVAIPPVASKKPSLAKMKVEGVYSDLLSGGQVGDLELAQKYNLTSGQVKSLRSQFYAAKAEVNKTEEEGLQ